MRGVTCLAIDEVTQFIWFHLAATRYLNLLRWLGNELQIRSSRAARQKPACHHSG